MTRGHQTPAGSSVLDELGLDQAEVVKAKLALCIHMAVVELGLTQREAAARMPITEQKLSRLMRGKVSDISQEKLEACLRALGHDIEIAIGRRGDVGQICRPADISLPAEPTGET